MQDFLTYAINSIAIAFAAWMIFGFVLHVINSDGCDVHQDDVSVEPTVKLKAASQPINVVTIADPPVNPWVGVEYRKVRTAARLNKVWNDRVNDARVALFDLGVVPS